jgi:serine/threonine protein kinase
MLLGAGSFGRVQLEQRDGKPVAVKYAQNAAFEAAVLRAVGTHPHVVTLYATEPGALVLELGRTTLYDVILCRGYDCDKSRARRIFGALLDAVAYLHSRRVVHRDLKAENVVMRSIDDPMIVDFGLAYYFSDADQRVLSNSVGSEMYAAPEVLANCGSFDAYLADVWSLGVLLFLLLTKRFPLFRAHSSDAGFVYARAHQRVGVRPVDTYFRYYGHDAASVLTSEECDALDLMLNIDFRADVFLLHDYLGYSKTS